MANSLEMGRAHEPSSSESRAGFDVAIVIVGFRNADDIENCLSALSRMVSKASCDVFICENGGLDAYRDLVDRLNGSRSLFAIEDLAPTPIGMRDRFLDMHQWCFRERASRIWLGCARNNLGYAGGINVWLGPLMLVDGWKGVWILNPDTEPAPTALDALIERAENGGKAMVGSTIVESQEDNLIRIRGGLHWQRFGARCITLGLHDKIGDPFDLAGIESALDCLSGASTYATRGCIERVGLMDESYFLFFEDLDWGARAKKLGLGYASESVVAHRRGTTTGSANTLRHLSRLSVYLEHRNAVHFVRKHIPKTLPIRIAVSLLYAGRFLLHGALSNFITTLQGLAAGLQGETGQPPWHRETGAG